ncbi:MAG: Gfo/Idh/MocA family oxidoreductase [Bacteroidetes bacterium]|nr:Gfo/Idh/MocA family oxidoreductase [Bacteroidota bacterium]
MNQGCNTSKETTAATGKPLRLIVLDPGHFHADLLQKATYDQVDSTVSVYAPEGAEVKAYLGKVEQYNTRAESPTNWDEKVYTGPDYLEKMLAEKPGNVVVLAGNNQKKTDYIKKAVDANLNVLADKPMAIDAAGYELLKKAFASAEQNNVLLYDIMTERYEITNTLQKELAQQPEIFGELQKGTVEQPAISKESVHHFSKIVSGSPLVRPAWFFDTKQQGEGIVDVNTHLVDLIQWAAFPEQALDTTDVELISARRWTTELTPEQFKKVTKLDSYPEYLASATKGDKLNVYANGEINYTLKDIHAQVKVLWNFEAPPGTGDTHYSIMRGSKANLIIRQGKEQNFKPMLYIEPVGNDANYAQNLEEAFKKVEALYPGISLKKDAKGWQVEIPKKYDNGHEAHFAQVANKYMEYLKDGKLPTWEVPNMITKYYTTTKALQMAK